MQINAFTKGGNNITKRHISVTLEQAKGQEEITGGYHFVQKLHPELFTQINIIHINSSFASMKIIIINQHKSINRNEGKNTR